MARPKRHKQQICPKQAGHGAEWVLRYQRIGLRPRPYHSHQNPIPLWIIHVFEEKAPAGVMPVECFPLITTEITS